MNHSLIYPTIDLYLYDLRQGLGQNAATLKQNDSYFLDKLPPSLGGDITFPEISQQTKWKKQVLQVFRQRNAISVATEMMEWETEFLELLAGQIEPLQLPAEKASNYEGYYYPVQLGDAYALLVDASVRDRTSPTSPDAIASLKTLIATDILKNRGGSLGQTWFVSAQVPSDVNAESDIEVIALNCYQLLLEKQPDWKEEPQGRGEFLGGRLFEWNLPNLKDIPAAETSKLDEQANPHVFIALYRSSEAAERAANFIEDWMRLFCYRHKILWAYAQSRRVKRDLQSGFAQIQDYVGNFKTEKYKVFSFTQLAQKLGEAENLFSDYAINLSYLEFQTRTIEVNLHNYRQRLKELEQKAKKASGEGQPLDLKWLEDFPRYATEQYLRQIRKDWENLSGGLKLLGIAVDLIRTDVQVKEARRDRAFQNTLGIVGAGLAAASVTASISGQFPNVVAPVTLVKSEEAKATVEQNFWQVLRSLTIPEPWLMPSVSLVLSLGVGVVAAGLTGLAVWLRGLGSHGDKK